MPGSRKSIRCSTVGYRCDMPAVSDEQAMVTAAHSGNLKVVRKLLAKNTSLVNCVDAKVLLSHIRTQTCAISSSHATPPVPLTAVLTVLRWIVADGTYAVDCGSGRRSP
jgi:hypothetical protein